MALIPLLFISISDSLVILVFLCVFDLKDEWWLPCHIFPKIHPSSISVLGTVTVIRVYQKKTFSCAR